MSVRTNLLWMALSQGALFVIQFGGSLVITRLLAPRDLGIYAAAAAVLGILSTLRSLGLAAFLIKETDLTPEITATVFTVNCALNIFTSGVIFAASSIGSEWLGDREIAPILELLAIGPLINLFDFMPSARLERAGAFRVLGAVNVGKALLSTVVTLLLAWQGLAALSIAWGNVAASVLGAVITNAFGWREFSVRLGLHDWRRVGRFGLQMLTLGTVSSLVVRSTDLLIARIIGLSALGLYSRASGLNSLLWDNLHVVVARVVFVDFAEHVRRGLSLRASYLRILAILTAVLWPAFIGMAIVARPLVRTIYGEAWVGAALPLSLLSLSGAIYVSITMTNELYISSGQINRQLRFELTHNVIGLALFAAGAFGGLAWAAASRIGDAMGAILLARGDIQRITQTRFADYVPIYSQSAGLTVLACAPALAVMLSSGFSEHTSLVALLTAILVGVVAWCIALWRTRHPLAVEARAAIRRLTSSSVRT